MQGTWDKLKGLSATLAAIVLLLPPAIAAASPASFQASFAAPAQAQGDLGIRSATWAFIVFHGAAEGSFSLDLDATADQT
jgi:hypothetical protein